MACILHFRDVNNNYLYAIDRTKCGHLTSLLTLQLIIYTGSKFYNDTSLIRCNYEFILMSLAEFVNLDLIGEMLR